MNGRPPGLDFGRGLDPFPRGDNNGNLGIATHLSSNGPEGPLTATSDPQQTPSNHSETTNSDIGGRLSNAGLQDHSVALGVGYGAVNGVHGSSHASSQSPYQHNIPTHIQDEQNRLLQGNYPIAMVNNSSMPPQSSGHLWDASLMSPGPSWWIGYDFDLDALNTSVSATMDMVEPLFQPQIPFNVVQQIPRPELPRGLDGHRKPRSTNDIVKRSWFTQIDDVEADEDTNGGHATGQMTPATDADRYGIDDNFRARVSLKLKPRTNDDPLPSVKYLVSLPTWNLCSLRPKLTWYDRRMCLFRYTLPNSTSFFRLYTVRRFDRHPKTPFYCSLSAP